MRRKGLFFLFLIFFTILNLDCNKQFDLSLDELDLSGIPMPDMSSLILPVVNQVVNSFSGQIQKNIESKKNSNQVHFVSFNDDLFGNYFVKDRICFVTVDVLKEDKNFYKLNDSSIEKIKKTLLKADKTKIIQEADFIVVYMNIPFYTYYQHSTPGLLNIFKNDPIYRNEIQILDSDYLEYLNEITELLVVASPDIIISKCDNVVFEHNVIESGNNKFIHSYLIETDKDLIEFGGSDIPIRDVTLPTIPVELTLVLPDTITLDIKTSEGIEAALNLLNSLNVSIDDPINIKSSSALDINITQTPLDINITSTPLDVKITETIPVLTDVNLSLSNLSLDLSTTLNVKLTDPIDIDTTTPLDLNIGNTLDIRITDTMYVAIAADSLSVNLTDTIDVKAWDNIGIDMNDIIDVDFVNQLNVKITDSIPVNLKEPVVGDGKSLLNVKTLV